MHGPLMRFLERNQGTDVFCLQEVYHQAPRPIVEDKGDRLKLLSEIESILPEHDVHFRPDFENWFGIAMLIRKEHSVKTKGDIPVYEIGNSSQRGNHTRHLQYLRVEKDEKSITLANVHALWNGKGKTDTEERLEQSRRIKRFVEGEKGALILCGDFNLLPDTQSIGIIESTGMRNLIKDFGIISTRTSLYPKPDKYADYAFVSEGVVVRDFRILPDEVSDHAAMYLEFE